MQQEQGESFIRKSLVFQFPPPLGLGALQRTRPRTAYYRSKQLAFAELQHLTLEPLLFATLYKYLWKLDKEIFWQAYSNLEFKSGESLALFAGLQDPQSDIWDDREWISPRLSFLLFNFLCSSGNWEWAKILKIGEKYVSWTYLDVISKPLMCRFVESF